jgi:hypothetical protein
MKIPWNENMLMTAKNTGYSMITPRKLARLFEVKEMAVLKG